MHARRNVLFITVDQWRGDCLGSMGHPCLQTPQLDRLAASGTLFRCHYGQTAPCGPARASLHTGRYLMNHRVVSNGTPLAAHLDNLALEVRKAGYDPQLIGYTDQTPDPYTLPPNDPALRSYEGVLPGFTPALVLPEDMAPWRAALRRRGYPADLAISAHQRPQQPADDPKRGTCYAPASYQAEDSDTAFVADAALDWLASRERESWFLHVSFLRPHPPWVAPAPYHDQYHPDQVPSPFRPLNLEEQAAQHPYLAWHLGRHRRGSFAPIPQPDETAASIPAIEARQARATYYGLMSEVDYHIGRLLDALVAHQQEQNTLVVLTSDHGEYLGDRYLWGKHGYGAEAYHIPLIIRDPTGQPGRQVDAFSEAVDVLPTILDWLGLAPPPAADGHSLLPWLRGATPEQWRQAVHWEYDFRQAAGYGSDASLGLTADQCQLAVIRDEHYQYVHFAGWPALFFDLQNDPAQGRNLAADPGYTRRVLDYAQRMLDWRLSHGDRRLTHFQATPAGMVSWAR